MVRKRTICENLDDESREKLPIVAKERVEMIHKNKKSNREKAFDEVKNDVMIDPSILKSKAFKIVQREYWRGI